MALLRLTAAVHADVRMDSRGSGCGGLYHRRASIAGGPHSRSCAAHLSCLRRGRLFSVAIPGLPESRHDVVFVVSGRAVAIAVFGAATFAQLVVEQRVARG